MAMFHPLRRYYDANTRLFLKFSPTAAIHRALWLPWVTRLDQALRGADELILAEARALPSVRRILDLGCGAGATLFYLLSALPDSLGWGVTISPVQARLAKRHAPSNALILEADFHDLPLIGGFDLAYAIEAFVHTPHPDRFFQEVARLIRPGGRLILVDDVLEWRDSSWRTVYQQGWHAPALLPVEQVQTLAAAHGLILVCDRDLTPWLRLRPLPDLLARILLAFGRPFLRAHPLLSSMLGSMALQQSLRDEAIRYHMLIFLRQ